MTRAELIGKIAKDADLTKAEAAAALKSMLDGIGEAIAEPGSKLTLVGFGTFASKARPARTARNPQTGEPIEVPARTVVGFKPGRTLTAALNPESAAA